MRAPDLDDGDVRIWLGDVTESLREMPDQFVQTCVTSPPYWGLRDYGEQDQIGLEHTPDEYVARLVGVFREVRRVLRDDGTLWLNLGDSYAAARGGTHQPAETLAGGVNGKTLSGERTNRGRADGYSPSRDAGRFGLKHKDLVGIPWRVAFALQADGWYLRSDIIWSKPNPMPESVTDRPTKAHEYVFLLSKSARYYYDADAIREIPVTPIDGRGSTDERKAAGHPSRYGDTAAKASRGDGWTMPSISAPDGGRNSRSVWQIATKPYSEAHFAVFPPELPERCIKAGSREGDTVLDPFMGSGTTAWVARHLGRRAVGCELNADYLEIAASRLAQQSLLADGAAGASATTTLAAEPRGAE
jgi:DNA modification methylase